MLTSTEKEKLKNASRQAEPLEIKPMRIAMLGTRGIPASYSGFENCAEELGVRLVERGHSVTVYCRSHHIRYAQPYYRGIRLVKIPTIRNKYFDTITHSFLSSVHAAFQDYDVLLFFIAGNAPIAVAMHKLGQHVALNVDGLDWKRQKWNRSFAKKYLQYAERISSKIGPGLITDSRVVEMYYRNTYNVESNFIPYGATIMRCAPGETLEKFGLEPNKYILFVGRLVPENGPHHLVQAFQELYNEGVTGDLKLVVVGDAPYQQKYIASLKSTSTPNIIFTGYVFGDGYRELSSNARLFAVTTEAGGTHPVLLESMAFGNCVIVNDTPDNLEVVGEAAVSYAGADGSSDLKRKLRMLLENPGLLEHYRRAAVDRVSKNYDWQMVTDAYEQLFARLQTNRAAHSEAKLKTQV